MMYNMPRFEQIQRFSKISSVNFPDFTNSFNRKKSGCCPGAGRWQHLQNCSQGTPLTVSGKKFYSVFMYRSSSWPPDYDNNNTHWIDVENDHNSSLSLKPSSNLELLVNQFNNATPGNSNGPEKVCSSKYFDIEEMCTIKIPHKNKSLSLFHVNACPLNKNFDDLQHCLKCTKNFFDIIAIHETRITKQVSLSNDLNLNN